MATQEDIVASICETKKEVGDAKDPAPNTSLNTVPKEDKNQADELPETLESSFDLKHVKKDNENSKQIFEGEQILGSPSITEFSSDAYTVPSEEIRKVNCSTATDPQVIHSEKTKEITVDAAEQMEEGLECDSRIVSNEKAGESHAVEVPLPSDTDATSAVIHEPKIENEDLRKTGVTGDIPIQCTGNILLGLEAEPEKYVDIKATTSSQSKEPTISLEERNVIADPQQILDEEIVDVAKAETLEVQNVEANICNEGPENNSPIQVDEHYQKKSEKPSLSKNAECILLEEPSESVNVASEDTKAFTLSQTNETDNYFEDQMLNANPGEILDDKTEIKPICEASLKEETHQVQSLATIASNEDVKESEKAPLGEHSIGLTHADLSETSPEVKIADEKIREGEQFYSEKNLEGPLLKKEAQQEKPVGYLQEAEGNISAATSGQDIDAACFFEDESLMENPQETPSEKAEERTADVIDKKEEILDIQNASISAENESLIDVDDSEKKCEELLVEVKIENAESKKPELPESPLPVESETEKYVKSIQIALENPIASDSIQSMDTGNFVEEKNLIADSQGILDDKIEDNATDIVETKEQSTEAQDTVVPSNEEIKEKLLIQVDGSQLKNEEHLETEAEKPCLVETSARDINSNKHNLEIGDEDLNRVKLLVNERNTECNLVKEEAAEEKLVKSFDIAKEDYKVSSQDKEVAKKDGHENPEECLQVVPQDDKVLIQKAAEEKDIVDEGKILSQYGESDNEKAEVVEVVESLNVAHEDDKPLSLDMQVEEEGEEDMVADSLSTAKDDAGLSEDTELSKEAAAEENLVEPLDVAYVADKALNPDLEEVNKVAYEENLLLVDPEKNKSSSQDKELAKEEKTTESSYVGLKGEKLEAEHEKLVESSDVVLEHDKAFVHDTEVIQKEVNEEHVAESLNEALPDKALSQDTEATKEETEEKNEQNLNASPETDAMPCQAEKTNDEEKLEEILYVPREAHKSLYPEAEVGKREVMAEKPTESVNVFFEDDGNQKTEVAGEEKAVDPLHITHEDAKALSQEAEVSITEIEEAKCVESLKSTEFSTVVFEDDGDQRNKVAEGEKVESSRAAREDAKALSQEAEVSIKEVEEAKPVECLKSAEFLNVVSEDDGNQRSKVAEGENPVESSRAAHEDAKALSQEAEVSIKEVEEAKPVECLKPAEFLNVVSEDNGNRSKVAEEEKSLHVAHEDAETFSQEAEVSITKIEEAKPVESLKPTEFLNVVYEDNENQRSKVAKEETPVESLCVAREDAKALSQEAEVSITEIEEAKPVDCLKPTEFLNVVFEDDGNQRIKVAEEEKSVDPLQVAHEDAKPLSQEAEVFIPEVEEAKPVKSLNISHTDDDEACQDTKVAKLEVKEDKSVAPFYVNEELSQDCSTKEEHSTTLGSDEVTTYQSKESNEVLEDSNKGVNDKDIELHMSDNQQDRAAYSEPLRQDTEVAVEEIEEVKLAESLHVPFEDDKELCLDNQVAKESVEDELAESFHISKEGEKFVKPSCVAPEDDNEIRTDISTKEPHSNTLGSHKGAEDQSKETIDEVQKDHESIGEDKDIDLEMVDGLQHVTSNTEPLSQDKEAAIEEVEDVKPVASLQVPSEADKELCLDNQVVEEAAKEKLVESFLAAPEDKNASNQDLKVAIEEEKSAESSCIALEDDKEINASISTEEPHNDALESHEAGKDQGKETIDEVQKDFETVIDDKDIASLMTDTLLSQEQEVIMEDIKIQETKDLESLHKPSQNDKEQFPDNQAAKEATKDQHSESLPVALVDEKVLDEDTKVAKEEEEKSIEPLCVAEDGKEISADISIKDPHSSRLELSEAVEDQIKETKDEVKKDPEIIVKDKEIDLPIKDNLQDVSDSETLSQDREVAMEKGEEVKPIESLHVPSEDDKTLSLDKQVARDEEEAKNKLVDSFHVPPTDKRALNEDIEVANQEESSCVAPEDDREISTDISAKEAHSNVFDSGEAAEDQNKEIDDEEQKDPESTVKSKDIDLETIDNLHHITPFSEPSSQDLGAAIEEVEEVKPIGSLHVPSEDDKKTCLDSEVAKKEEEEDHKLVESFLVAPENSTAAKEGEKFVQSSSVALDDDKEIRMDISIKEPHSSTLESHVAAEEQIKETNNEVKDCEIIVKDKDIDLKMTDNLQNTMSYSELCQDPVVTMEEVEEVKPSEPLHVIPEDDKTSYLEIQTAAEYAEDKIVESFHVAPEDKRTSDKDTEVSNEEENSTGPSCVSHEDDKETSTDISTTEPRDNALGSFDTTEYQIKETNDEKDLETIVTEKDTNLQMKDDLQHVTPYSESLSREQELAMEEIEEMKLVESLHIPSEDDKEICLKNQVMKEEGENKPVESFYVAPLEEKASNQDSEVPTENEKVVESSCVALEDKEIIVEILTQETHNKSGSYEAPDDQSKETNDEVQKDPETTVRNKDIEFQLTDDLQHATSQDRDILTDEIEKVMLVESSHAPREDDKEVCTDDQIAKEEEAEDKLVKPFDLAFVDRKASNQDTGVSIERENVTESSSVAFEDDKKIRTDTSIKDHHNSILSSGEAEEDQTKETNYEVQKDPETAVKDKDIKLQVIDDSQNVTPYAKSLSQERQIAAEEVEKIMPIESLHLPSDDDKEFCPENQVVKEEQEKNKLGQSFDLALADEKESNPDSRVASKAEEESNESSCVAVEDGNKTNQDISTKGLHNSILVSQEEAKEQSKEVNEEVEDDSGSMALVNDIELQLRDNQHFIPSPEALSQDTEVLKDEIESKSRECLTEHSEDGKESSLDKGEEKLAASFYVAPEDDKASFQATKEVSELGEEKKPTGLTQVQEDPETTAKDTNIDLQMTDNQQITPYSENTTDDEAHAFKETTELEGKSSDRNIEKDFDEVKIEEKPAINILVQEETCQEFDVVTDNSTQVISTDSDEKRSTEDEMRSTELDVEEKRIQLEDVTRPTETSDVSHEQAGSSVLEVSEEEPRMSHEKIEETHVSHEKGENVTSIMPDIPKKKRDHTSTDEISCNEEAESEKIELFGDELSTIAANKNLVEVDSKNEERELEVTTEPVKEEEETETVKLINASLEEEERSQDFSKQIMDNPERIPADLKANEQGGEEIACIQEIGTISETKEKGSESKIEEMAKEFLQKPFTEPAEVEDCLTAEKDLTADEDVEKAAASENKILCGISETPIMIKGRGMDLATSANEAVDENINYEIAGHEKTSYEITDITEATVTKEETSLRGYLIDDSSKCEIKSSDKFPEINKMTTSTESQAVESLCVEEAPTFEFLPARAELEEANIGCLATPKFKKVADESVTESCTGENEARLGLEEEISKEEDNAKKENVENISEKEIEPNPLKGVPESLTQVQHCDVISKSEETSGVAKTEIKSERVVLEEAFEPKETTYEKKEIGETNMLTEKIKYEDEDSKDDFTGSHKEEIVQEIQTENKVDEDVEELREVMETAKGNEEVSKVFEDPNDTQEVSTHIACNDNGVEELGGNLQSKESIDISLNQTAERKSVKEVPTLLDTEEVVHYLETTRSECERSIEKAESSAIEFEDNRSTADDIDNKMIKESKKCAADPTKAELPGKPNVCTVSEPATKPPYETLEHYEDNRGYSKPIVMPQQEDPESKQLVREFSQEKGSEKLDDKNEISSSDKVVEEDALILSSEKTDEKTSITDNWSIVTGNDDGKTCIENEKLGLLTDKQVVLQADHIENLLAPEKKKSTESSLINEEQETFEVKKEEANCGNEEQEIKEVKKSMEEPETEDVHKPSLEEMHQVSSKKIDPIADCSTGEEPTMSKEELYEEKSHETKHEVSKTAEEHDEEEELCGQHKSDSSSEAPVMVDVGDADIKPAHKKSHNILSGVGSKVKHSIAKVKKAIIGKPSHPKPPSPKEGPIF